MPVCFAWFCHKNVISRLGKSRNFFIVELNNAINAVGVMEYRADRKTNLKRNHQTIGTTT